MNTTRSKHVPIPRFKERNVTHLTSQFYAHVSRNATSMASDSTRPLLRGTQLARRRLSISGRLRMVTSDLAKLPFIMDAYERCLSISKRTGDSNG